jgi:hypothetical protein
MSAAGAFLPERGFVMLNRIDIDHTHSRAIVREIGERMRASLRPEPELPARFKRQIDRLRELEPSPSIIPAAERWDKPRQRRRGRTWTGNAIGEAPCVKNSE